MDFFSTCSLAPWSCKQFVQRSEELLGYVEACRVVDVFEKEVVVRAALYALLVRNRLRPTEAAVFILGQGDCCGARDLVLAVPFCANLSVELCAVPPLSPEQSDGVPQHELEISLQKAEQTPRVKVEFAAEVVFLVLDGLVVERSDSRPASRGVDSVMAAAPGGPSEDRLTPEAFARRLQQLQGTARSHGYFFPSNETNHDWIYSYGADRLPLLAQKASSPMWQRKKPEKMASLIFQDTHLRLLIEPQIQWQKIQPFLKERQMDFSEETMRSMLTVTFNCAAQMPIAGDIEHLFEMDKPADMIFVALQETCPLALAIDVTEISSAQYHAAWTASVTSAVERRGAYRQIADHALVGLQLLLYVKEDLAPEISQTCWGTTRCGTLGAGNKGAVALGLVLKSTSFCFVNAHLAAGESASSSQDRSQDFDYIVQTLRLSSSSSSSDVRDPRNLFEHDLVVWAGDLNMRLWRNEQMTEVMSRTEVLSMLQNQQLSQLLACDELHRRRLSSGPVAAFEEAAIHFHPSYKFRTSLKTSAVWKNATMRDTQMPHDTQYDEKRSPAWCDRIMWRARRKVRLEDLPRYERLDRPTFSDHRPVRLYLEMCVHEMSWDDLKRVCAEYEVKRSASHVRYLRSGSSLGDEPDGGCDSITDNGYSVTIFLQGIQRALRTVSSAAFLLK
ncbi:Ocrl [Symbiodinium pilosum]|uniref:Ocrl protein n=1 Tax=Symbiodinium pilosum TaxID=2952 RepID=A0A812XS77_SYMPI|nr:Ocrl [Symbiodinium pilosum]